MQRLKLFGGISIETDAGLLSGRAVQRRRLALLTLLAAARARGVSRDRLIAYLWPNADAENGRRFLSDSVYRINQALGGDVILAAGDDLRLDAQRLPSDLGDLEDALSSGDYETAAKVYAGPFLDGFFLSDAPEFERWVEGERDRHGREYARALEALALSAERAGSGGTAVSWWRRLAAHDPYNSRVAVRLMQSLAAVGERGAAIQHARVHETLLAQELEVEPDPAVRALADKLRHDPGLAATAARPAPPPYSPAGAALEPTPPTGTVASADASARVGTTAGDRGPAGKSRRRWSTATLVAAGLAILAVVVAGTFIVRQREGVVASRGAPATPTIAVLPFANLSADPENEYFSDGITEELITTLGQVGGLRVASRTSVFAFKNKPVDVREVGRRLGVAAVVEGSVRKSGRRLRITTQLVNTANGYDLWSATYERELDDVFAVQEEIARAIVARLVGTLGAGERVSLAERSTRDPEAYDLYLKGRFAWHQRTRDGLRQAVEYFGQAVARAPDYARAHVGLGDAYAVNAFYDYLPPRDAYPKAEAAARRAIELDRTLAAPHATLAYVLTYYDLDWTRAEEEFRRALAADPSYSTAHQWYGNLLTVAGRFADAERAFRAAQEADPLSLIAHAALGWGFYYAGRYDAALEQYRRTLALDPNFELAHLWGGWALGEMGRESDAREWIGRAVRLSNGSPLTRLALARLLARSQSAATRDTARAIVAEVASRRARGEYMPAYEIGKVHLALGDRRAALEWLTRTVEDKSHSRAFFRVDPQLAPLRGDPRFEALVAKRAIVTRVEPST
ncbi:MAG: tetratricopeptide repeat protein [Gemmatimonadota bacterium]|nr:tetratricopeptide repeat protein [Gemmatimonadota bacterium]